MRTLHLAAVMGAALMAATMAATSPAAAHCCGQPVVRYGVAPAAPIDALDPWYPVRRTYVVNQGPVFTGPGVYAYSNFYVPTVAPVWDGRYRHARRYPYAAPVPYVRGEFDCHAGVERCAYGYWHYWRRP
jgi:hypothetical protein